MPILYKTFEISPAPEFLVDSGKWTLRTLITRHNDNDTFEGFFSGKNLFDFKEQAELNSIEYAKQIIDGINPEHSLKGFL